MKNPTMLLVEAAHLLGVPTSEIRSVAASPAGLVMSTSDGVSYIHCTDPDGAGQTGLLYLAAPTEKYTGSFPVYVSPIEPPAAPAPADDPPPPPAPDPAPAAKATRADLAKQAAALGLTVTRRMTIADLEKAIADHEAST